MPVDPKRVQELFLAAVEGPDSEARAVLLERLAGNDPELLRRVQALLRAHDAPASVLDVPFVEPRQPTSATAMASPAVGPGTGAVIGPYKLLQELGEGGMGTVYMAEQSYPVQRKVALKVVKPGMDSRQVIARFEAERQALAVMDHPNIARVLDAGTTDTGRPYFVMELVKGVPINRYCDEHQLSPRQRLELLVDVCHAVQHAHQKGIIHRDLKPSNVLVAEYDDRPVPKVIDFGVAKAVGQQLTDKTMFTAFGQVIGTIEYMSPEHAKLNQLDIDTRSDVYSLGVILYELLTGQTPFDHERLKSAAFDEMLRIVREEEPVRPSTRLSSSQALPSIAASRRTEPAKLTRLVHGELDWIAMKALEKDRNRRYESANAMATDIQRYLADEPLSAAAPSRLYRLQKFVRRNKGPVIAAALLLLVLVVGTVGTTIGLIGQARQRAEAQRQAAVAQAVGRFQLEMLSSADPANLLGEKVTVLQAVQSASNELDRGALRDQPIVEAAVRYTLGRTLLSLGRLDDAEPHLRKAVQLCRGATLPAGDVDLATALGGLADLIKEQGKLDESEALYREALAITRAARPVDEAHVARELNNLALLLTVQTRYSDAEPMFRESLELARKSFPPGSADLGEVVANYGTTLARLHDLAKLPQAEQLLREAADVHRKALPAGHPRTAGTLTELAAVLQTRGKLAEAEPFAVEALEIWRKVYPPTHQRIAQSLNNLGWLYQAQGKLDEAAARYREALEIMRTVLPGHFNTARLIANLAQVLYDQGKLAEAEPLFREALQIRKSVRPPGHPDIQESLNSLGVLLKEQGNTTEAEPLLREAVAIGMSPNSPEAAASFVALAELLTETGRAAQAEQVLREALPKALSIFGADDWRIGATRWVLGRTLAAQNKFAGAESELLEAERVLTTIKSRMPGRYYRCVQTLVDLYLAWEKAEPRQRYQARAASWRTKLPTTKAAQSQPSTMASD